MPAFLEQEPIYEKLFGSWIITTRTDIRKKSTTEAKSYRYLNFLNRSRYSRIQEDSWVFGTDIYNIQASQKNCNGSCISRAGTDVVYHKLKIRNRNRTVLDNHNRNRYSDNQELGRNRNYT
uniref:Uncharacterized protein n=1 Tax=Romanomermis culicivorax TaxID=13658 RepID=A0A915I4Y0_ROMCU